MRDLEGSLLSQTYIEIYFKQTEFFTNQLTMTFSVG